MVWDTGDSGVDTGDSVVGHWGDSGVDTGEIGLGTRDNEVGNWGSVQTLETVEWRAGTGGGY